MSDEGDTCPECEKGTMALPPVVGCTCHISPPCGACISNPLTCDTCGYEEESE